MTIPDHTPSRDGIKTTIRLFIFSITTFIFQSAQISSSIRSSEPLETLVSPRFTPMHQPSISHKSPDRLSGPFVGDAPSGNNAPDNVFVFHPFYLQQFTDVFQMLVGRSHSRDNSEPVSLFCKALFLRTRPEHSKGTQASTPLESNCVLDLVQIADSGVSSFDAPPENIFDLLSWFSPNLSLYRGGRRDTRRPFQWYGNISFVYRASLNLSTLSRSHSVSQYRTHL
jgi:hypothetical protein